jgi:hypothetical protein
MHYATLRVSAVVLWTALACAAQAGAAQATPGDVVCFAPPNGNTIVVHTPAGGVVTIVTGGPSAWWQGQVALRDGGLATLALGASGFELLRFDAAGQVVLTFPVPELTTAHDMALTPSDELLVLNWSAVGPGPQNGLYRYTVDGLRLGFVDLAPFGVAPHLVRITPSGAYWLVQDENTSTGAPGLAVLIDPSHVRLAGFRLPFAVGDAGVGRDGSLWVSAALHNEVARFDTNGVQIGSFAPALGTNSAGHPLRALGVAPDLEGGVWVSANQGTHVARFDASGTRVASFQAATAPYPVTALQVIDYGAPIGATTCAGATNSTGNAGRLTLMGEVALAANSLTLNAAELPPGTLVLFLASRAGALVPSPGGSTGVLCLGGAIGRFQGPGQVQQASATGQAALAVMVASLPTPTGLVPIVSGETWHFQAWYRDTVGGAATSNLSAAQRALFH